jgi:glycosyltransferase involved in cell wall biosynthesis
MVIFPNHSVLREEQALVMELAEADLVQYLQKRLGNIAIAAFEEQRHNTSLPGRLDRTGVRSIKLNAFAHEGSFLQKVVNYVWAVIVTPFTLISERMAYIFCPGYCAAIASVWAIILRRPYGLYVRGTWLSDNGCTSWLWRQVFRNAAFIIATGESFRRRLAVFNNRVENEVPLSKLAITAHEPVGHKVSGVQKLLFAGRLIESKGIMDLIQAVAIARQNYGLHVEAVIAGGGTPAEEARVKQVMHEHKLDQHITLLGHVSDIEVMKQCYQSANAFVFPTYYKEGFPRVLYEAMMFGLPIITTAMPGTDGFLVDGKNCLICKPRDPNDIAKCIAQLAEHPQKAIELAVRAHHDVVQVFRGFKHASHAEQLLSLVNQRLGKEE